MKKSLLTLSVLVLLFVAAQTVWAFPDTKNDPNASKIADLQTKGIVKGDKDGLFKPEDKLTYAAGISIIVGGLDLNLDTIDFIKEPKASDYFTKIKDDAWYSDAFVISQYNDLNVPKDVDPAAAMTREEFAYYLFQGVQKKGDYAFIDIYMLINDEADVNKTYMNNIQRLLISKIVTLDSKQNFYPTKEITRGTAAGWLFDAIKFVETAEPVPGETPVPSPLSELTIASKAVNDNVNEVTVSATVPHPGYGLKIASISFDGDKAILHVEAVYPEEDKMYPQVITEVKAVTYVSAAYTSVLGEEAGSLGGSDASDSSTDIQAESPTESPANPVQ
ncbi:S-layer homology domain-containing protein [Paenibacillus nasutitermitis]|uniref:SLH domain-containing protein n=1 Tax=Paenibacillus nasutitermitis TaxID=1652958 RepID=A0A916Z0G7_9BACL|nr:S-layer homology domain-containing protein [Paenibacillus nasutitermitis]GGD70644.1 hypothetical protein GCM10010911_30650 [Paenibacillus nasutitermitis]